jgi:predicted metal-dependent hydrolase
MKKDISTASIKPDTQLALVYGHSESWLSKFLEERLGKPVSLVLTDNGTTMLSARARDGVLKVRLHRMFLAAGELVFDEIAAFLKNRKRGMPLFRGYIRDNQNRLEARPPKKLFLRTAGKFHELSELYQKVNEEYFEGRVNAAITWGARSPRCAVRKRTLGSFSVRSNAIRINPVLDRKSVPRYYVAFVVYHEMLHADLGIALKGKRRSVHSREFRRRERLFKDYDKALAWESGEARDASS